jgi:hypothetical protein
VTRAIDVGVVPGISFVLDMGRGNRDAALALLRSVVDLIKGFDVTAMLGRQDPGQGRSQSGLTMVNVTDGTDINVRLAAFEFFFRHFLISSTVRD